MIRSGGASNTTSRPFVPVTVNGNSTGVGVGAAVGTTVAVGGAAVGTTVAVGGAAVGTAVAVGSAAGLPHPSNSATNADTNSVAARRQTHPRERNVERCELMNLVLKLQSPLSMGFLDGHPRTPRRPSGFGAGTKKPCSESGSRALRCSVCPYLILEGRRHQASAVDRTRPAPRETRSRTYRCGTAPDFDRLPLHGPGRLTPPPSTLARYSIVPICTAD